MQEVITGGTATQDRQEPESGAAAALVARGSHGPTVQVRRQRNERGMVSAEWAVGIIAAIAIAGVLLGIVTSGPVHDTLLQVILKIINTFSNGLSKLPN